MPFCHLYVEDVCFLFLCNVLAVIVPLHSVPLDSLMLPMVPPASSLVGVCSLFSVHLSDIGTGVNSKSNRSVSYIILLNPMLCTALPLFPHCPQVEAFLLLIPLGDFSHGFGEAVSFPMPYFASISALRIQSWAFGCVCESLLTTTVALE